MVTIVTMEIKKSHLLPWHSLEGSVLSPTATVRVAKWRMCEVPPFSICFSLLFHTTGVLWILPTKTVSDTCNKSHVLILSVWFHQDSDTLWKEKYEVLFVVSITDIRADKLKYVWLAETLLLGYIKIPRMEPTHLRKKTLKYCQIFGFWIKLKKDYYSLMLLRIIWFILIKIIQNIAKTERVWKYF